MKVAQLRGLLFWQDRHGYWHPEDHQAAADAMFDVARFFGFDNSTDYCAVLGRDGRAIFALAKEEQSDGE